jgi:hypothetical protein
MLDANILETLDFTPTLMCEGDPDCDRPATLKTMKHCCGFHCLSCNECASIFYVLLNDWLAEREDGVAICDECNATFYPRIDFPYYFMPL